MPDRHLHGRADATDLAVQVGPDAVADTLSGYVLAGGKSSRFGSDKARALLRGRPLLGHAIAGLQAVAKRVTVVTDRAGKYAGLVETQVAELVDTQLGLGPMGGLAAVLADLRDGELALIAPCDVVGVAAPWLDELIDAVRAGADVAAFRHSAHTGKGHGWEPLHSVWRKSVLDDVTAALQTRQTSVSALLDQLGPRATAVPAPPQWYERVQRIDTVQALSGAHAVARQAVKRLGTHGPSGPIDVIAVEQPLEIRIAHGAQDKRSEHTLAVTLRTPGDDAALIAGLLIAEGIVLHRDDLVRVAPCVGERSGQIWRAELAPHITVAAASLDRQLAATAACGLCGKGSLAALMPRQARALNPIRPIPWSLLAGLPDRLRAVQLVFSQTGGVHGAAVFDQAGTLLVIAEDIGRHNAVDKALGQLWLDQRLDQAAVLVLSGRAGFELLQKAAIAGVPMVLAIGAPTTLAVELANERDLSLIGFVRNGSGTAYAGAHRVL